LNFRDEKLPRLFHKKLYMIRIYLTSLVSLILSGTTLFAGNHNADTLAMVERIHKKILTVDSHTDTPLRLTQPGFDVSCRHDPDKDHSKVDFPRMKEGGLDAAFFGVFVSQGKRTPAGNERAKNKAFVLFDTIHAVVARYPKLCGLALEPEDAWKLKKQGKLAVFIGIENGYTLGNDIDLVRDYYNRGARYITLCHTKNNDICDSSTDTTGYNGLSEFGRNVVAMMNRTGMMIDVSHISDKSFYDVLAITQAPVIASHSCARAICNNPRNMDDEMLRALARNGGVIQMCILSDYVKKPEPYPARDSAIAAIRKKYSNRDNLTEKEITDRINAWDALDDKYPQTLAKVSDVVDHIDHIVKVAGIDHVGIGTDFDGGGGVTGCYDASQMRNITYELIRRGYSVSDIGKIWGGNLMRVMKQVRKRSKKIEQELSKSCACQ
jgi:membrane dipeptidase